MEPALAEDSTGHDIITSHPVASCHGGGSSLVRSSEAWSSFREYLIIAHYLHHTAEIDAYLSGQRAEAAAVRQNIEQRFDTT
jgi:hypothetical protein